MSKNIELELRAEILKKDFTAIYNKLEKSGKFISETDRLSVMFFGNYKNSILDIRIRITNGQSEVVIKKGDWHSHNRTEFSQIISNEQFIDMIKIMSQFGFDSKVGERKNFNFKFPDEIIISLVKAGDLLYLEIEKMTDELNQVVDKEKLYNIAKKLGVEVMEDKQKFNNFCKRLFEAGDWKFNNTDEEYEKLKDMFKKQILSQSSN